MLFSAIDVVESRPINWLWPGRLALGKLAIVDGDPGLGKSLVTLDLCARLSRGRPFPDNTTGPGCANALILNGEDNAADTIRPRLQALDADLQRVFVWHAMDELDGGLLSLPADTAVLEDALTETHARLLVIDPIMAFLGPGVQSSSDTSVRRALLPLARLADRHNAAVLMVRHLNKQPGRSPLYRGGGSIGFLAACRSGWLIARHPKEPGQCVLAPLKNNLAQPQPSLAYQVEQGQAQTLSLTWLGPTDWTAAQLLARPPRATKPAPDRERACEFLEEYLHDGPRTSREIWDEAKRRKLRPRTLERAKKELAIRSREVCNDGQRIRYWLLPGQELPKIAASLDADLDRMLEELKAKYPPPSPLDEPFDEP
jgi:hypothetical protein